MIDNSCILASIVAVGFVVLRAYVLNATLPWFGRNERPAPPKKRAR